MSIPPLTTRICFPSGVPSGDSVHTFLRLVFEEFRWFEPMRYGDAFLDRKLDPRRIDYSSLVAFYEEGKNL